MPTLRFATKAFMEAAWGRNDDPGTVGDFSLESRRWAGFMVDGGDGGVATAEIAASFCSS